MGVKRRVSSGAFGKRKERFNLKPARRKEKKESTDRAVYAIQDQTHGLLVRDHMIA